MAIPASVIPAGNSYSVNVAGPGAGASGPAALPDFDVLTVTAASAAALLNIHNVDVRRHLTGDDPAARAQRDFLARAGAKTSAFSPAPSPGMPGEGFWKTTVAVVQAARTGASADGEDFWWPPRADKKVEWEPVLVALGDARTGLSGIPVEQLRAPDLWILIADGNALGVAEDWVERGAGAVAAIGPAGAAWASRGASFGNAAGRRAFDAPIEMTGFTFGCFAGGVIAGLIEELLGENAFDKSIVRVERSELEARPLHVGKAAEWGAAAARADADLHKSGDLLGRARAIRQADNPEGPSKPWGSKGR